MDSIKKKMEKLASETAEAEARIAHFEELKVSQSEKMLKVSQSEGSQGYLASEKTLR